MTPAGQAYQIAQHAKALERWFQPAEALAEARRQVEAGQAWRWPDPTRRGFQKPGPVQLILF